MLKFYGGAPATILCDNLKTAVIRPDRYEAVFTDVCAQLGEHYCTTFSATRPYSPRDKAMVERAVNIVYNNIFAPLRNQDFTSLTALNAAIAQQLILLNDKPYKKTPYSRNYLFKQDEQHLLKPLGARVNKLNVFLEKTPDSSSLNSFYRGRFEQDGELLEFTDDGRGYYYLEFENGDSIELHASNVKLYGRS
ncbi:hypothetical protein MKQ68_10770 [Chitinophaga horti]|uniref:Integrase catalytic domain-containing protein n=1 Tax=Chitinophaga horti TaxID=2920382 RepID=A0ABY6J7C2_9BACT|nr:hypothetical protein [Chitinophaga horti]UYQ95584.1 hypothetical protein MKQ68_10770 [Chitinophaga horti]